MNFKKAIKRVNALLKKENPIKFKSSWISSNLPYEYQFIAKTIRTEVGDIDWDKVISSLPRRFQKCWMPPHHKAKCLKRYRSKKEVELAVRSYKHKIYVFTALLEENDKWLRDTIAIPLVRIAQKGNIRAEEKLLFLLKQIIYQWVEYCPRLYRWKGHQEDLDIVIKRCIYCYRFTGSFIGYLFKSLEYSAWGLKAFQAYSIDACKPGTTYSMADTLTKDPQTGRVVQGYKADTYYFH